MKKILFISWLSVCSQLVNSQTFDSNLSSLGSFYHSPKETQNSAYEILDKPKVGPSINALFLVAKYPSDQPHLVVAKVG